MRKTLKVEKWNQNEVRFVWHNDEWWAVAKDVAKALGYSHTPHMVRRMDEDEKSSVRLVDSTSGGNPNVTIISEAGIYEAIFGSNKKEAKEFKKWVKRILKELREASGLEGFQVFRMLDKDFHKSVAVAICKGVQAFYGKPYKAESKSDPAPKPDNLIRVRVNGKQVGAFAELKNAVGMVEKHLKAGMTVELK